jgi:hypothetical protein
MTISRAKLAPFCAVFGFRPSDFDFSAAAACAALLLCSTLAGCVTKAQAKAQARAAYLQGQQEATIRLQQPQLQGPSVRIIGPVKNPVVPWTSRLTLSQAILAADYEAPGDPIEIIVLHNGMASRVNVRNLLNGQDVPLQPGDVVQLVSSPPSVAMPEPSPTTPGASPEPSLSIPGPSPAIPGPSPPMPRP